jgi:predicted alpha-1,6-mannanase (GH76 family)
MQAISTLQNTWYDSSTGLWDNMWWNSANCLTTISKLQSTSPSYTSFRQQANTIYETSFKGGLEVAQESLGKQPGRWLNNLYDDEGWWALAWIQVYDVTGNQTYLEAAQDIYADMKTGLNHTSCGGLLWQKETNSTQSIENAIFLDVAAKLTTRAPNADLDYLSDAEAQYEWFFHQTGLLTPENLIADGLDPPTCKPGGGTFTYNQGATIGALVSLSQTPNPSPSYLDLATSIAQASISHFAPPDRGGILTENCDPACDTTAAQFKGVFIRNLAALQVARPNPPFRDFIEANAESIWRRGRDEEAGRLGSAWAGPYTASEGGGVVSAMCSGLDGLVGAAVVG